MTKENRQEEIMQQHAKSGKFGKQTLQEIQEENRRLILEVVHGCSYEEALRKEIEFAGWSFDEEKDLLEHNVFTYCFKVTLSIVLLAISKITNRNPFESSNDLINLKIKNCFIDWNLEKETLELQDERVQISINKLLTE